MSEQPWYVTFFGESYLELYEAAVLPERTDKETALILERLSLPPGSGILDLCCGHGRHSIRLAARGFRVTGQDLSEVFLAKAKADPSMPAGT